MIKYFVIALLSALIFQSNVLCAQSYGPALVSDKIILNYDEYTVVTFTKPVKRKTAKRDQDYYWFSGQVINHTRGGYSGKLLNGKYEEFYLNKNLRLSGWFSHGLKIGSWKNWDEKGRLTEDYAWRKGKKNGRYYMFNTEGKQIESGRYKSGLLNGKQSISHDSTKINYFSNGKLRPKKQVLPKFISRIFKLIKND